MSVETNASPLKGTDHLAALRAELRSRDLSGFLVPRSDEYQNEYVPANAERLAWLTGFTGSAGFAVVLLDRAAFFTDGRYTLQGEAEVDGKAFEHLDITVTPPADWIAAHLPKGSRLGIDPRLHSARDAAKFKDTCRRVDSELTPLKDNPIDGIWVDRPDPPLARVVPHDIRFAGMASHEKRADLGAELVKMEVGATVLTSPDSIAWLLNIRGGDVDHTPLPLSTAILKADGSVSLFLDPRKVSEGLAAHLGADVTLHDPCDLEGALSTLAAGKGRILLDPSKTSSWFFDFIKAAGGDLMRGNDPCTLPKACKNVEELDGARAAHLRDGAALTSFLAWLAQTAPKGGVSEMAAAQKLYDLRKTGTHFMDLSFPTISGSGPNGAVVHYRVSEASDRMLCPGDIYLLDSGAQYLDGTTDVTRTLFIDGDGTAPSREQKDRFTRVLKGHIALACARFPKGTTGLALDVLARQFLWAAGLDFDHGTGHGVGSYLGVHEGPQRIAKAGSQVALKPGMIVSNEPGYYKTGEYGIRIESLVAVRQGEAVQEGDRDMLGFETLTLAPIDKALIDPALLEVGEIAWLDAYHERVREMLAPMLDDQTLGWLNDATAPLADKGPVL